MPKTLRELEKQQTMFDRLKNMPLDELFGEVIHLFQDAFRPKTPSDVAHSEEIEPLPPQNETP